MQMHQNTFTGGLDTDTSVNKYDNTKYFKSENFRVIMNGENSTGAITNIDGTKRVLAFDLHYDHERVGRILAPCTIIGMVELDNHLVLFLQFFPSELGQIGGVGRMMMADVTRIYKIPISELQAKEDDEPFIIYLNATARPDNQLPETSRPSYLVLRGKDFGFTKESRLRIVARKENNKIQKVYFTDGNTPLFAVNLADPNLNSYTVDKFEILPKVNLSQPKIVRLTSGRLKAGRVQYAYQLYNLNGAETVFSPASNLVNITDSSETGLAKMYKGTEADVATNKGVVISLDNLDSRFDRLRIVRIVHDYYERLPVVQVFHESGISGSAMTVTDSGNLILEELLYEEFNEILINPKPKTLEAKNNYLFLGNVEVDSFDFDFDATAKRYNNNDETYPTLENPFNEIQDVTRNLLDPTLIYNKNPDINRLGGKGENVSYRFITHKMLMDKRDLNSNAPSVKNLPADTSTYTMPLNSSDFVGYQRDEIYRFGLVGYDENMRPSFVKWIDDIRFPDFSDVQETETNQIITIPATYEFNGSLSIEILAPVTGDTTSIYFTFELGDQLVHYTMNLMVRPGGSLWARDMEAVAHTFNSNSPLGKVIITSSEVLPDNKTVVFKLKAENLSNQLVTMVTAEEDDEVYVDSMSSIMSSTIVTPEHEAPLVLRDFDYELVKQEEPYIYGNALGIEFKVQNLPSEVKSYQIVRARRDRENRTVIDLGMIGGLAPVPGRTDDAIGSLTFPEMPIFPQQIGSDYVIEYSSPEHVYNRLSNVKGDIFESIYQTTLRGGSTIGTFERGRAFTDFELLDLNDFRRSLKILNHSDHHNSPHPDTVTPIGSHIAVNGLQGSYADVTTKVNATKGSCKLLMFDRRLGLPPITNHDLSFIARRRNQIYPYGGLSYSSLSVTEYIPCGELIERHNPMFNAYQPVWNGDVYISYFIYNRLLWSSDQENLGDKFNQTFFIPIESTINLDLVLNHDLNSLESFGYSPHSSLPRPAVAIQEKSGAWLVHDTLIYTQDFDLYRYNSAYSIENASKKYISRPMDFQNIEKYPNRIHHSEKKVSGETFDSWMKYRPNNFEDTDSKYGELVKLYNFRDNLFFFQPSGIGIMGVEQRELLQTSAPGPLVAGTGDKLSPAHYLVTNSGLIDYWATVESRSSLYYFDRHQEKLSRVVGQGTEFISDSKSISSLVKKYDFSRLDPVLLYDPEYNEVLFSLDEEKTLIFNEYLDTFTGTINAVPKIGVLLNNNLFSASRYSAGTDYIQDLNKHNIDKSRVWYRWPMTNSKLTLIVNPQGNIVCLYDILEFTIDMLTAENVRKNNTPFTSVRLYNEYQDTGEIKLIPDSNIIQRFRTWRMNELFDSNTDGSRLRSSSLFMDITYNNKSTDKILLHDVITKLRSTIKQ